ncbi:MAG: DNA internalization-related competence protein ComEC/Rec2 [Clostridiales bacterium]|nr:DNA internalization-related competence protein ComEC/Rec2 [Clostridiales bacterium]
MRRTICLLAVSFGTGIFAGFYFEFAKLAACVVACAAVAYFALKADKSGCLKKILVPALVFFVAGAAVHAIHEHKADSLLPFAGQQVSAPGVVLSVEKKGDERYQMVVRTLEGKSKVLVNVYGDLEADGKMSYGDVAGREVQVCGVPELPSGRRNPKTFDYRLHLKAKGINVVMNVKPGDITVSDGVANRFANAMSNIRCGFSEKAMEAMSPGNAGILIGMLFGDKNMIGDDVYEMFQKNGTAHVLAVSGLHMGVVYLFLSRLLRSRRNVFLNTLLLFALFSYAALAAFSPSVLRAGAMIALHILSKLVCMRYDMLCAGAGTALAMMLVNPLIVFDTGFLLSFLAIFTLAIVYPAARRLYDSGITAAVALQVGMAPATAYLFNYFSAAALFINIPVIFIAGVIIPIGVALIPVSYAVGPLFPVCAGLLDGMCEIMYRMNEFTYAKGGMFCNVASPPLFAVFAFYGLLFCGCSEMAWIWLKRKGRVKPAALVLVIIVASYAAALPMQDGFRKAQLVFVDVGQGDCLHIRTPGGKNILIDGGGSQNYDVGKKTLMPYLLKNGVSKIDMAFVSHRHLDHYGGIVSLANNFNVGKLCLYEANRAIEEEITRETGLSADRIVYLSKGQKVAIDKDVWIEILYPEKKTEEDYARLTAAGADENDISLIMKVHYYGFSVLMTGDVNTDGEGKLISAWAGNEGALASDLLKVAHHGSKYSSSDEFLSAVSPKYAVFQVGKNTFGHPTPEVVAKIHDAGAQAYRNDRQGAIGVLIKKGGEKPEIKTVVLENQSQ